MIVADLANVQVWVATAPIDMRKSFDGLAEVVRSFLGHDPLSGSQVLGPRPYQRTPSPFAVGPCAS